MYLESHLRALTIEALDRSGLVPLTHWLQALVPGNHKPSELADK